MRPKGSSAQLEQRRRDALAMLRRGTKPAAVARTLRVSLVSVGRWRRGANEGGGGEGLAAPPGPRPPPEGRAPRPRPLPDPLPPGPAPPRLPPGPLGAGP